jgi:hypothetical protein
VAEQASWRADRLDVRLQQGRLSPEHLCAAARALATRHAASRVTDVADAPRAGSVRARLATLAGTACGSSPELAARAARALRFAELEQELIEARVAAGRVHRGIGVLDLTRVHVDANGRVTLAAAPSGTEPHCADTAESVAALAVALQATGRSDLADAFLGAYAEAARDFELYRLLPLYETLAILGRADRETCALRALPRRPRLVGVGGPVASERSATAVRFAREIGSALLSDAAVREALGASADAWSLHRELLRRGAAVLDAGRPVVLDADFASRAARRAAARTARERGLAFLFVECRASHAARDEHAAWDPVTEIEDFDHLVIKSASGRRLARGYSRPAHKSNPFATSERNLA